MVLKNPEGRQKMAPMAVAVAAMSCWFWPWSRCFAMNPSMGHARIRPTPQEIEVHSKGEKLEPLTVIVEFVSP